MSPPTIRPHLPSIAAVRSTPAPPAAAVQRVTGPGRNAAAAMPALVQRSAATASSAPAPAQQAATSTRPPTTTVQAGRPTSPTTAQPAPPAGPVATGPNQRDLDELARRLYGPIVRRLKAELRRDRERSGRLTDLERRA